jgi:hypothetical protein
MSMKKNKVCLITFLYRPLNTASLKPVELLEIQHADRKSHDLPVVYIFTYFI